MHAYGTGGARLPQLACPLCGGTAHAEPCPNVKAVEFYPDGTIKRVEYREAVTIGRPDPTAEPRPAGIVVK